MTIIDTDKDALGPIESSEGKTIPANKSDGRKLSEPIASTEASQARKPSDDEYLFDNLPI
jgi:hypothetical protein